MTSLALIDTDKIALPSSIISRADLSRLIAELEKFNNRLSEAEARQKTGHGSNSPALSERLLDFFSVNQMELGDNIDLAQLISQLRRLKDHMPIVHLTFASDADEGSLQEIVKWLRQYVHQQAVVSVGLQPELLGGVYVRTTNQVYDLSVRKKLETNRGLLVKQIKELAHRG